MEFQCGRYWDIFVVKPNQSWSTLPHIPPNLSVCFVLLMFASFANFVFNVNISLAILAVFAAVKVNTYVACISHVEMSFMLPQTMVIYIMPNFKPKVWNGLNLSRSVGRYQSFVWICLLKTCPGSPVVLLTGLLWGMAKEIWQLLELWIMLKLLMQTSLWLGQLEKRDSC